MRMAWIYGVPKQDVSEHAIYGAPGCQSELDQKALVYHAEIRKFLCSPHIHWLRMLMALLMAVTSKVMLLGVLATSWKENFHT